MTLNTSNNTQGRPVIAYQSGTWDVSGTITANAGTNLNTSLLALESGNLQTLANKDFSTSAKQDTIIVNQSTLNALITTLNSLVESQNELSQRLEFLASCSQSGRNALRIVPLSTTGVDSTVSTVTTVASVTAVASLTNFGTGIPAKEMADDINNQTAILSNIQNVVV